MTRNKPRTWSPAARALVRDLATLAQARGQVLPEELARRVAAALAVGKPGRPTAPQRARAAALAADLARGGGARGWIVDELVGYTMGMDADSVRRARRLHRAATRADLAALDAGALDLVADDAQIEIVRAATAAAHIVDLELQKRGLDDEPPSSPARPDEFDHG